jgi:hypothetical protein
MARRPMDIINLTMEDEAENLFGWHPLKKVREAISHATYETHKDLKKVTLQGLVHDLNRFDPAVIAARGILLLMIEKNVFGIAPDFAKEAEENSKNWQRIAGIWQTMGGKANKLQEAAEKGKGKRKFMFDGGEQSFYDDRENITAADKKTIVGGTAALGGLISSLPLPVPGAAAPYAGVIAPVLSGMVMLLPDTAASKNIIPPLPPPTPGDKHGSTSEKLHNFIFSAKGGIAIVGGLGVIGLLIYLFKK